MLPAIDCGQARQKLLEQSLAAGIIDRARFEECVAESAASGPRAGLVVSSTRMKGGELVADHSGLWEVAGTGYASSQDAMRDAASVSHGDNGGQWAWNQTGTKVYKRCNFHKDCPVLFRTVKNPDNSWRQEVLNVSHALQAKQYRHARAQFTYEQEAEIKQKVDDGLKPHKIRNEHTLAALAAGCTKKRDEGGLAGVCCTPTTLIPCAIHKPRSGYMHDTLGCTSDAQ